MNSTTIHATVETRPRRRHSSHLRLTLATTATVYLGFWFTYFGRTNLVGGVAMIVLIGGSFVLMMTPGIGAIESGVAWIGKAPGPLYPKR